MRFAVIGCGYIAAFYAKALPHHPELELAGAWDIDLERRDAFAEHYRCHAYGSEREVLADPTVDTIANLTNPRRHADVTRAALKAGKHVYSEKPLGMTGSEAFELVTLARRRGVMLASAPCSVLSETAQTVRVALNAGTIGKVRLVYANFDDGMIAPHMSPWNWKNEVGVPWPAKDEFEVGCTYEHAGYMLTWLAALFGPALRVTSFASCQLPDKGIEVNAMAPDFTAGCIGYADGVVARLTCSLVAPEDKSLMIVGDKGVLKVVNVRHERCPVRYRLYAQHRLAAAIERRVDALRFRLGMMANQPGWASWRRFPYIAAPPRWLEGRKPVDFLRGLSDMAVALRENRSCKLPPELGWHVAELIDALQHPGRDGARTLNSSLPPTEALFGSAPARPVAERNVRECPISSPS